MFFFFSKKGSIQYNGPHLYKYYSEFLEKALNPVVYLGTRDSAKDFISGSQVDHFKLVISSFHRMTLWCYKKMKDIHA